MSKRTDEQIKRDLYLTATGWAPLVAEEPDGLWFDPAGIKLRAKEAAERQLQRQSIAFGYWAENAADNDKSMAGALMIALVSVAAREAWPDFQALLTTWLATPEGVKWMQSVRAAWADVGKAMSAEGKSP